LAKADHHFPLIPNATRKSGLAPLPLRIAAGELCNARMNLAAHHWKKLQLSVPHPGSLTIELRVIKGNPLDIALIPANQLADVEQPNGSIYSKNLIRASMPAFRAVEARAYQHAGTIDKGEYVIVLEDTKLGILSSLTSDIEIHAYLAQ